MEGGSVHLVVPSVIANKELVSRECPHPEEKIENCCLASPGAHILLFCPDYGISTRKAESVLTDAQDYEEKEVSDQLP